ncbi:MAG: Hsp20 family protein, partial [gamma proteobacterium symbiont of Bathyaustriella thionipta]|nr:Hsp20 family protein [gamma proteobacterium symbiont of Bathyaustriella thionipta]MCU7958380.1 Hsp20 family protein [gamma proteobacterium symbiont of Bathyaustriella thionipta]
KIFLENVNLLRKVYSCPYFIPCIIMTFRFIGLCWHFLHHGIAARNFEHRFQLADHVKVTAAHLINGLLNIELVREIPEAMKPHTITINTSSNSNASQLKDATIKAA